MKISKYLKVDPRIDKLPYRLYTLKKNKLKGRYYLVCIPHDSEYLFEIISAGQLNARYQEAYLVGFSKNRTQAIDFVKDFIDELFNQKTLIYDDLKT
jgi:hypothetical protein